MSHPLVVTPSGPAWRASDSAEVLGNPRGVQTLHEVTDREPQRSWFYREVLVPEGAGQWLLVALRSSTGENWGTARLNRAAGEPMFSEHEIDVKGRLHRCSPRVCAAVWWSAKPRTRIVSSSRHIPTVSPPC